MTRSLRRFAGSLALAVIAAVPGCDKPETDEDHDPASAAPIVIERASNALSAAANLAYLADFFNASPTLRFLSVDEARLRAVRLVQERFEQLGPGYDCEPDVAVDPADQGIDITLNCPLPFLDFEGTVNGAVEVQSMPCDEGQCPVSVNWTIDVDLTVRTRSIDFGPQYRGEIVVRSPLDPSVRGSWSTGSDFTMQFREGTLSASTQVGWSTDLRNCVELDLEAELELADPGQDARTDIDPVAVSAQGMRRCFDGCPEQGNVFISYGAGSVLQWSYDSDDMVNARGPRGSSHMGPLPCGGHRPPMPRESSPDHDL